MNIFIFHRDLRLIDNTSLIKQIKDYKNIIPIFIFDEKQINPNKNDYFSNYSVQFMIESLEELEEEIEKKNGELYYFKGNPLEILKKIKKVEEINSIGFNFDYSPYALERDNEIKEWCIKENINIICEEDYLLHNLLEGKTKKQFTNTPYNVFTAFKNNCMTLKVRDVDKFKKIGFEKKSELKKLKENYKSNKLNELYNENKNKNISGGRSNGLKILKNISKFKDYSKKRDELTYKTTFLGAHLKFNTLSIREVYNKIVEKVGKSSSLINELIWRDFYVNIAYFYPKVLEGQIKKENKSFKEEYDNIKWTTDNIIFKKWCEGKTGYPIVDAAMRQLNTIGYMHNRARMIVASFLTKDLHIDWRLGEKYFAQKLIDYDPYSNNGGWQWCSSSGTDAQPYFRIFNPWTQAEKFDKKCEYIKKWLPELNNIPSKDILKWNETYEEWLKKNINYYKPIIDHSKERDVTLKLYKKALD